MHIIKIFGQVLLLKAEHLSMRLIRWRSTDKEEFFNKHYNWDLRYLKMVELAVEQEVNLQTNKFGQWKSRNVGFSLEVEEEVLNQDKFIVFWNFRTCCLILGQSWKIWDSWNLCCCHACAGAPSFYLELLDKLQEQICRTVGPSLAASLEPLAHQNVASINLFYRYYFVRCSSELAQLVPPSYSWGRCTCYSEKWHDFFVTIPMSM